MATTNKNFRVKNGLDVAGTATFDSPVVLGANALRFNSSSNKLEIQINNVWSPIAFTADIPDTSGDISFMDIGLAIDYNGQPIYTVQANGINTTATKFASGGSPSTTNFDITFDSGVIS
jgi:hypothetical protein